MCNMTDKKKSIYPESELSLEFMTKMREHSNNYSETSCKGYNHNFRLLCVILSTTEKDKVIESILNGNELLEIINSYPNKSESVKINVVKILSTIYEVLTGNPLPSEVRDIYKKKMATYQSHYLREIHAKKANERLPLYSDFLENVKSIYGEESQQFLLCSLYKELTCRDDFSQLLITPTYKRSICSFNYIIVKPHQPVDIILNQYKTSKKHGPIRVTLTRECSGRVKKYINQHNLQYGSYLFPQSRLSGFVGNILERCGLTGSISTLRKMIVSEFYNNKDNSDDELEDLAHKMGHDRNTAINIYLRNNVEKNDNEEKEELN